MATVMSPAHFWFGPLALKSCCKRFGAMLKMWSLSVRRRGNDPPDHFLTLLHLELPCPHNLDAVLAHQPPHTALANLQTQLIQLLRHARSTISGLLDGEYCSQKTGKKPVQVRIVIDDEEARGFLFSYEKLFGAKGKSDTDAKNEAEGKETAIDRTRRLFYVTCSRAEQSLAVAAYSANPAAVRETVIRQGWFSEDEVEMLAH